MKGDVASAGATLMAAIAVAHGDKPVDASDNM